MTALSFHKNVSCPLTLLVSGFMLGSPVTSLAAPRSVKSTITASATLQCTPKIPEPAYTMWRSNPERTGIEASARTLDVEHISPIWRYEYFDFIPFGGGWGPVNNTPVVSQGRLFVPIEEVISYSNPTIVQAKIFAFDLQSGKVIWHKIIDGPGEETNNFATPVISGNYLYQITGSGLLAALRLDTGESKNPVKWPKQLAPQGQGHLGGSAFDPSPALVNGKLFICSGEAFYIIDLATDEIVAELWGIENFAVDSKSGIIFGSYGTEPHWRIPANEFGVKAYRISDILAFGDSAIPVWQKSLPKEQPWWDNQILSTPIAYNGMVYIATLDVDPASGSNMNRLYALNKNTGVIEWFIELPGEVYATGVLSGSYLYQPAGKHILKISLLSGLSPAQRIVWTYTSPTSAIYGAFIAASPVLVNGMVFASVPFGELPDWPDNAIGHMVVRLDASTGALRETYPAGHPQYGIQIWNGPFAAGNYLIVAHDAGIDVFRSPVLPSRCSVRPRR